MLGLLGGIGLTPAQAVGIAALIGPGQVAGRVLEWLIGPRVHTLTKARIAGALFPLGAALLLGIGWMVLGGLYRWLSPGAPAPA